MAKLITKESLCEDLIGKELVGGYRGADGEMVPVRMKITGNGKASSYKAAGEMTTPADLYDFRQKSVVDMTRGLAEMPILYSDIYRRVVDPTLSRIVDVMTFIGTRFAFTEVKPGESVNLGDWKTGSKEQAEIVTIATAYGISRDWLKYNELWRIPQAMRAVGVAYNAKRNDTYLGPILAATYAGTKTTAADATGATEREKIRNSIRNGLMDSMGRKNADTGRVLTPTIILTNSVDALRIAEVVNNRLVEKGSEFTPLAQVQKIIAYDGASVTVAGKTYTYSGVAANTAYLIEPQSGFVELVKEDLVNLSQGGDIFQLLDSKEVWEAMIGCIADVANYVQKVSIPARS